MTVDWTPIDFRERDGRTEALVRYADERPDEWREVRGSVEAAAVSPDGARRELGEVASTDDGSMRVAACTA